MKDFHKLAIRLVPGPNHAKAAEYAKTVYSKDLYYYRTCEVKRLSGDVYTVDIFVGHHTNAFYFVTVNSTGQSSQVLPFTYDRSQEDYNSRQVACEYLLPQFLDMDWWPFVLTHDIK